MRCVAKGTVDGLDSHRQDVEVPLRETNVVRAEMTNEALDVGNQVLNLQINSD